MIEVKIQTVARKFNVNNAYQLQNFGDFPPSQAAYIWKGEWEKVAIKTLNKLCNLFSCTPNDILEFSPDEDYLP